MSLAHTNARRIEGMQDQVGKLENEIAEGRMVIDRIESENEALENYVESVEREAERRARRQDVVNNKLSEKLRETREKNAQEVRKIRADFKNDLIKINKNTKDQIEQLRNQTNKSIADLRKETRLIYEAHKKATDDRFKIVNKDIARIKSNIISIENDIATIKQDKVKLKDYTIDLVNDLQILINNELNYDRSPFLKKETAPGKVNTKLQHYKLELDSIISDFNSGVSAEVILQRAGSLYSHFSNDQFVSLERERDLNERYRGLIAQYEGLLIYASKNKLIKIKRQKPENPSFDQTTNKWNELPTEDWVIDLDYWSYGSFQTFLDVHTKKLDILKQDGYSQAHFVDDAFLDKMEKRIEEVKSEYVEIERKARRFAVNSNIREVIAHKMIKKLEDQGIGNVDISFEKEDQRNRLHINAVVRGDNRHFILGADSENAEKLNTTFLQGDDHHRVSAETFEDSTRNLIDQINNGQLGIEIKSEGTTQVIQTELCGDVKNFKKGMTKEATSILGQK